MNWSDEMEADFLASFVGDRAVFRPVGTPKHFAMLLAYSRFSRSKSLPPTTKIDIESLWAKLESLYDLDRLELDCKTPFPNERCEFSLPGKWVEQQQQKKYSSDEGEESESSSSRDSLKKKTPKKTRLRQLK